jgi:hypothetical protein
LKEVGGWGEGGGGGGGGVGAVLRRRCDVALRERRRCDQLRYERVVVEGDVEDVCLRDVLRFVGPPIVAVGVVWFV